MMTSASQCLKISQHSSKGRMVIATQPIQSGAIVEIAPVIAISAKTRELVRPTELFQYCFVRPDDYKRERPASGYLVLGFATLCNHSNQPNAVVEWLHDEHGYWAHLIALEQINSGKEIVLRYTDLEEYQSYSRFQE
ncbi:MAG: SET domain-containing protein-lysine N-methyltransferase [Cyanobacteria bacterium P01_E01_bin.42]